MRAGLATLPKLEALDFYPAIEIVALPASPTACALRLMNSQFRRA